jgi:hypothetical protein
MNERIKELAEQAAWKTRMAHNNAYWRMSEELPEDITWREKFAEMIVRECADLCRNRKLTPSAFTADELLEYFGVEE